MRYAYASLIIFSMVVTFWFILRLGAPWRSQNPRMALLWALSGWVAAALDVLLLLVVLHIPFSPWIGLAVLALQDGVYGWRLSMLYEVRRDDGRA